MKNKCLVLCEKCCCFFSYTVSTSNHCDNCGSEIAIDSKIEQLVVNFNILGIATIGSCQGHRSNCGVSARAYPWIALLNSESVTKRAEDVIGSYNERVEGTPDKRWKLEMQRTSLDWKIFIVPEKKDITELENTEKIILLSDFLKEQVQMIKRE